LPFGYANAQQTAPSAQSSTTQKAPATTAHKSTAASGHAAAKKTAGPLVLKTDKEKASYAIGMSIGKGLHRDAVDVDPVILERGLKDAIAGGKTLLTDQEAQEALTSLQAEIHKRQEALRAEAAETNKKEGEAFLAANKTKEGVVALPSGLQYKILQQGTGAKPTGGDTVVCNYRGTLINGKEFDSSYKRGEPVTFPVGQVIKGWTEALQLMPVGSKWQLFIPAELAYGDRGAGPDIGPDATIIFEVELLSIKEKAAEKPAAP